jgi:hypothetical protein
MRMIFVPPASPIVGWHFAFAFRRSVPQFRSMVNDSAYRKNELTCA